MSVEEKIKANLMKDIYTQIDTMYDFVEQHYVLSEVHRDLVIKHLNKFKDQIYLISENSKLS